jgi:hypothetical protein
MTKPNNTKQILFKTLDGFISELGCAEMRIDELLRDLDYAETSEEYSELCKLSEQVTADLTATVREFNAQVKKIKQL